MLNKCPSCKVIGFTATPEIISPFDNILSSYSIYDGFLDKVILPPKIVWVKSENSLTELELISILKDNIKNMPYKKIVVWCGIIDECIKTAREWMSYFLDFDFCIDFMNSNKQELNI